jgi:hypothetical protein
VRQPYLVSAWHFVYVVRGFWSVRTTG